MAPKELYIEVTAHFLGEHDGRCYFALDIAGHISVLEVTPNA